MRSIDIKCIRQHNLQGFDLTLPLYQVICITGVSGSGKSSLAFDTLYAEGQRRYAETFSAYIRQYLERLPRPDVKSIDAIPPTVAIGQTNPVKSSRSTVGTLTEITHFMKMLFYRASTPWCPVCGIPIQIYDPVSAARRLLSGHQGKGVTITAKVTAKKDPALLRDGLIQAGYFRAFIDHKICDIDSLERAPEEIEVVVDRLKIKGNDLPRLLEAFEQGFRISEEVMVHLPYGEVLVFSNRNQCPRCGLKVPGRSPGLFSFNSPVGACPECRGFGRVIGVNWDLVIPDKTASIEDGAITVLEMPSAWEVKEDLMQYVRQAGIPLDVPWKDLPKEARDHVLLGDDDWYGVEGFFKWLESKRYKTHIRILLSRYRAYRKCPHCHGTRFSPGIRAFRLNALALPDFYAMEISRALEWTRGLLRLDTGLDKASILLAKQVIRRLEYLEEVGLHYLTLDRQSRTLSGGEVARAMLTRALSSQLVETLYVLDEPTIGLHPMDTNRIIGLTKRLSAGGNTVIVVEHDPGVILTSDFVVDLGPGAGEHGGRLLFSGNPKDLLKQQTPTSIALRRVRLPKVLAGKKRAFSEFIEVKGARENNLKDIDVRFPRQGITVISGPSGSGKSTLLELVLYRGLLRQRGLPTERPGTYKKITGDKDTDRVILLEQATIGKSPRANPATYLKAYDHIRPLLACTPRAKELGLTASIFSFNSSLGRCPRCKGLGVEVVEMQFLPDLYLPCPECKGRRFQPQVLSVHYQGKNVSEILELTICEAIKFFDGHPSITSRLEQADQVGLGYLRLGQPLSTLSGGESQRLKIARELFLPRGGNALFLLDEPTVGLHMKDVSRLLQALAMLRDKGHTVVLVEHHMEVLRSADWVVDLGPGGGTQGGRLMYQGPVEGILKVHESATGQWLNRYLQGEKRPNNTQYKSDMAGKNLPKPQGNICMEGARHHNLKDISLKIPRGCLTVITGVSGSGKSTLAFDIIFAEGQRRYIESLPAYVRQFLKLYEQPEVDLLTGLPPTVAIEQRTSKTGPRSTVGTLTEAYHYLRLLYAKVGKPHCPKCGAELSRKEPGDLAGRVMERFHGEEVLFLVPKIKRRKGFHRPVLEAAAKTGFNLVRIDGRLQEIPPIPRLSRFKEHTVEVCVARILVDKDNMEYLAKGISKALDEGDGELVVMGRSEELFLSRRLSCPRCNISLPSPDPLLFSFNTAAGACPRCDGLGEINGHTCPGCLGTRLRPEALAFKIGGMDIGNLCAMPAVDALAFLNRYESNRDADGLATMLASESASRLSFLCDVGLSYLSLSRGGHTLSEGEAQRVRICAQLGSNLSGVCYVLDEPTIGLHPRDNRRLLNALSRLKDRGNTVLVVEHDEECIRSADFLVDLGPGGGRAGGKVIYAGQPQGITGAKGSLTASALLDGSRYRITSRRRNPRHFLRLSGANARNLKGIDVKIPLSALTGVTGVSGSGKSTLVMDVLYRNLAPVISRDRGSEKKGFHCLEDLEGYEGLSRVLVVDHCPIGRTPRSTPATYVGLMDHIRNLFAGLPASRSKGWGAGRFSFNIKEGRCRACKGQGRLKVEMKFLPEVYIPCEVCSGNRYNEDTLSVHYKGRNIAQVLDMTMEEAREFFKAVPPLARALEVLCRLGLGYLTLGQASPSLSGGEAQRIKLAAEFIKAGRGKTLYILDEPSTGLHMADVARLMELIQALVDRGDTVLIIEHNLEVIKQVDWVIDLGPDGGDAGGRLLFQGPIDGLLERETYTAQALRDFLKPEAYGPCT